MDDGLEDALVEVLVGRLDASATVTSLMEWATRALGEGAVTESIVYLAGMPQDCSVFEAGPLLDRGLRELGVTPPPPAELRRAYVGAVSRALLAGDLDVQPALDRIHARAVSPLGHPPDLAAWCFLWEGLDPADYHVLEDGELATAARRLASEWAGKRL